MGNPIQWRHIMDMEIIMVVEDSEDLVSQFTHIQTEMLHSASGYISTVHPIAKLRQVVPIRCAFTGMPKQSQLRWTVTAFGRGEPKSFKGE